MLIQVKFPINMTLSPVPPLVVNIVVHLEYVYARFFPCICIYMYVCIENV